MPLHHVQQLMAGQIQRLLPRNDLGCALALRAYLGLQQPCLLLNVRAGRERQRGAFGAQPTPVGGVFRVSPHSGDVLTLRLYNHTTAHAAVWAGGPGVLQHD